MNSREKVNYFEQLGISIEDLQGLDEGTIVSRVNDSYRRLYNQVSGPGINNPRFKSKTQGEWQTLFSEAKDTLIDPAKRRAHIEELRKPEPSPEPAPRSTPSRPIVRFPNGDEATSIPELATLMMKHSEDAKDALYAGDIAASLSSAGELRFTKAAREVVEKYPNDQDVGFGAMVQILEEKIQYRGGEAKTPQQLARLIDQNWEDGKDLLYGGFIALWLKYVNQEELANTADKIISRYADEEDKGLELFVQRLDPRIGSPDPKPSHTSINFGKIDNETKKTIHLEIENAGRGFLYGDVQLASKMQGLQISSTSIIGSATVTVELDAGPLTAKRTHKAELIINTNGGKLTVPVSCYVDYPIQKSIRRVAVSSISMAAIALVARLIVTQLGNVIGGFKFSWLASAMFVDLDANWGRWFEWPMIDQTLYIPHFAGFSFVISFAALCTGIFFFFRKRGSR